MFLNLALSILIATATAATPPPKAAMCAGCHGEGGNSMVPIFPKLAGQQRETLVKQLKDFRQGTRMDPMMSGMAAGLTDSEVDELASYYSLQPAQLGRGDLVRAERGRKIFQDGLPEFEVPACAACHGSDAKGFGGFLPGGVPALAGQHASYVAKQLKDFRAENRTNDRGEMMRVISRRLEDGEIDALAEYLLGMEP